MTMAWNSGLSWTPGRRPRGKDFIMVRKHIYFSGRVQGVGFRYQAAYYARNLGLTGWVRNLSDGRVEMEVQGRESLISQLILRLKNQPYIRIEGVEYQELPVEVGETKFSTRFSY